jgi:hypothetical protein
MKTAIFASVLYVLSSFVPLTSADTVYYCDSPGGKKFHYNKECRGLQKCTHAIRQTTVAGAEKKGLTACKLE